MPAATTNLTIEQGASFDTTVVILDQDGRAVDLTDYEAVFTLRELPESETSLLELATPSDSGEGIDVNADGTVRIRALAETTAALDFFLVYYDLLLTAPDGTKRRALQGLCQLSKAISRVE